MTTTEQPQHQTGSQEPVQDDNATASAKRADRLLRLVEQMTRSGGTLDAGLRDMLAEVTAMEAAYLFADQMSWSETVLPEYRRSHRPSKGRGQNKTYGPELGRQAAINGAAAIMYGRALGIGMVQSLQVIHNINGKSGIEARTMQALCERAGVVFTFDPTNDGDQATVAATRPNHKPVSSTWTMQHAEQRGYTSNPLYNSHPDEMLRAKALAECCRLIAPDVVLGLAFTYEELQLDEATTVQLPPPPAPTSTVQAQRGMAALGQRLAGSASDAIMHGGRPGVDTQPQYVDAAAWQPPHRNVVDHDQAHDWAAAQADQDQGYPQQDHSAVEDAVARVEAKAAAEPAPPVWTTNEAALTILHTALGKAGFEHRSQKLGIVGALVDRELESTKHITDDELGLVNHTLKVWQREGNVAENCRQLLAAGDNPAAVPPGDAPVDGDDGTQRATTKELQALRKAYKDNLRLTGKDMLEHIGNTLGWNVDDINALSANDVAECLRVATPQAD